MIRARVSVEHDTDVLRRAEVPLVRGDQRRFDGIEEEVLLDAFLFRERFERVEEPRFLLLLCLASSCCQNELPPRRAPSR